MAITLVHRQILTDSVASATTLDVTIDAGVSTGDLIVIGYMARSALGTLPSGFTKHAEGNDIDATTQIQGFLVKESDGTEGGTNVTITQTSAGRLEAFHAIFAGTAALSVSKTGTVDGGTANATMSMPALAETGAFCAVALGNQAFAESSVRPFLIDGASSDAEFTDINTGTTGDITGNRIGGFYALYAGSETTTLDLEPQKTTTGSDIAGSMITILEAATDTTAPVLSSPTGTQTGTTTATGTVSTDEANGTLDAVVTTSATTPSAPQIQAGQDHTGAAASATDLNNTVTTTGVQSVSFTGLTAATTYYVHYVHEDAAGNVSNRETSTSFTTDATDVTAPVLSSPTGTQTGQTTADLSVSTDEGNGTLYWAVSTSATPPSVAQIQAGNDSTGSPATASGNQAVSTTGAQTPSATGLTAATTYYAYFQHQDAATNDSTVADSPSFTTAATAVKGVQLSLKQADGTTAAASLTGLYYHVWDALNPGGASDANGSAETTDASGVLEINIDSFTASIGGEVFLMVYNLDGTEDKDSTCFVGRVPVVDIA